MRRSSPRGSASVEAAGLCALIALLVAAVVAALAAGGPAIAGRELASTLGRKIRCATQLPGPCWRDPLTLAYGRSLAGAVRALAPAPTAVGGLVPVDFRYCRSVSCALPGETASLTASNRRVSVFVSAQQGTITYWSYRPSLGWERETRDVGPGDIATLGSTPLLDDANPVLVPLETLDGRNHYDFAPAEEPPWRWQVESVYP